jgi:uncharacterized damage-inducible protein DinB
MAAKKMTELFLEELETELPATRRALERVPEGRNDWKPHPKSMALGYLAGLVANMPSWVTMTIKQDELDLNPPGGGKPPSLEAKTTSELLEKFDEAAKGAREALASTTDDFLLTPWRLLVGGQVVLEQPRYVVLRTSVINHLVHHRAQLTVYLRLNEAAVPALYGPSADERSFG